MASHTIALGLIVPIATFHLGCAVSGARFTLSGHDPYHPTLMAGGRHGQALAGSYLAAAPALTMLLLLLGFGHGYHWNVTDARFAQLHALFSD